MKPSRLPRLFAYSLLTATLAALVPSDAFAVSGTWTGSGTSPFNWSNTANWVNGIVPTSTTSASTSTFGASSTSFNVNLDGDRSSSGLTFAAGGYTLGSTLNSTLSFGIAGVTSTATSGTNNINFNTAFSSTGNVTVATISGGGNLNFGGTTTVNISGTSTTLKNISYSVSGGTVNMGTVALVNSSSATDIRINKTGDGTLRFSSSTTLTGITRVNIAAGTVAFGANSALASSGTIISTSSGVENKAILIDTAGVTVANQVQFLLGGTNTTTHTIGSSNTSGTATYSASIEMSNASTGTGDALLTNFTAATGGRIVFTGVVQGRSGGTTGTNAGGVYKIGGGTVVFSGTSNTYSLGTKVTAGTLLLNNTPVGGSGVGSGSVTVDAGATLGGSGGRINLATGNSVNINGTVAVGDSSLSTQGLMFISTSGAGAFNLNNGSAIVLEIWDTSSVTGVDRIVTLAGNTAIGSNVTLNVTNAIGTTITLGRSYNLFDWTGGLPTGTFTTVALPTLGSGLYWDTSDLYNGGAITVIPEPSTVALCGLGLVVALRFVRRNRRS